MPYKIDLSVFYYLDNANLRDHIERVGVVFYERKISGLPKGWEMRKLGEAYSPERWKGIVGDVRRELLATSGDSAYDGGIPNAALRESVCVLYEALYDSSGALKCGECAVPSVRDEDL